LLRQASRGGALDIACNREVRDAAQHMQLIAELERLIIEPVDGLGLRELLAGRFIGIAANSRPPGLWRVPRRRSRRARDGAAARGPDVRAKLEPTVAGGIGGPHPRDAAGEPGLVGADDAADVLSFMLERAGVPAGENALPPNRNVLSQIEFNSSRPQ
jgi:hypothetical protein